MNAGGGRAVLTRRTTRAGARITERLPFADRRLANSVRIDHALAIARQPDPGAVMRETTRELATARGIARQSGPDAQDSRWPIKLLGSR